MDDDLGITGRSKEIKEIYNFVLTHVASNKSGLLYLTGPPGTGKTMSINHVLGKIEDTPKIHLNCFKATSPKSILIKIWQALNLGPHAKKNESEMIARLASKFSGRTCRPFLMVLDEMDQLPKSSNSNLFSTIFSWTKLNFSKLIIIGIANTLNLTARCETIVKLLGSDYQNMHKIIFKPYSSKDIYSILTWYLENDEQFEEASVDSKALEMISKKIARDKGDIRNALDALKTSIDDMLDAKRKKEEEKNRLQDTYPTPPSTPPPASRRELANIASVANSVKKRQRQSHYHEDSAMAHHEVVLICLHKLCSKSKDGGVDKREFYGKVSGVLQKFGVDSSSLNIDAALEHLEMQGLVVFKKRTGMKSHKILLRASETEISGLSQNMELISKYMTEGV